MNKPIVKLTASITDNILQEISEFSCNISLVSDNLAISHGPIVKCVQIAQVQENLMIRILVYLRNDLIV